MRQLITGALEVSSDQVTPSTPFVHEQVGWLIWSLFCSHKSAVLDSGHSINKTNETCEPARENNSKKVCYQGQSKGLHLVTVQI